MYRFISSRSPVRFANLQHAIHSPFGLAYPEPVSSSNVCSYCRNTLRSHNLLADHVPTRCHSTKTSPTQKMFKKKARLKYLKKYVELLEVNEKQTNETKASVSKLKAIHLSKLSSRPEVTLEHLHELTSPLAKPKTEPKPEIKPPDGHSVYVFNEDYIITFTPDQLTKMDRILQNEDLVRSIKDSYDKFRREQKNELLKDIETSQVSDEVIPIEFLDSVKHGPFDFNDLEELETLEESEEPSIVDPEPVAKEIDKNDNIQRNNSESKPKKGKLKKKILDESKRHIEMMQRTKQVFLIRVLHSYLDICISNGSIDKAYKVLMNYRNKGKRFTKYHPIDDINLYNVMLLGFAKIGDYEAVLNMLNVLKEDSIQLNAQSYAAIFESVQRSNISNKMSRLKEHYKIMTEKGLTFHDVVNESKFAEDQWEVVMDAIKSLDPNYVPKFDRVDPDYNCDLVNDLNPSQIHNLVGIYNECKVLTSPAEGVLDTKKLSENIRTQIKNECSGLIEIKNVAVDDNPSESVMYYRDKLKLVEREWRETMHKSLERSFSVLKSQVNASPRTLNIYPYLMTLNMEDFIELMLLEIRMIADGSETFSPGMRSLQKEIGAKVYNRYYVKKMKSNGSMDKKIDLYKKYCHWYLNKSVNFDSDELNTRRKWQQILHENKAGVSMVDRFEVMEPMWSNGICTAIGKVLYNILLNDVKIDVNMFKRNSQQSKYFPILYNVFRGKGKFSRREVKPHPMLPRLFKESVPLTLNMETVLVPSLSPPLPWSNALHGGYLISKTSVMRTTYTSTRQIDSLVNVPVQNIYPALDSLNQLGAIPWIINKPVLDVLISVFKSGGSKTLNVAQPASSVPQPPPVTASLSKTERAHVLKQCALASKLRQEAHSLWCEALYKLSLANHFRDEIFWLPHNMDFRGRVYPCPPHLSHLGSDSSRALLVFAQGRPLGQRGLCWLKLHCINLTGTMKRQTVEERLSYVESIMDDILDSADNPLNGRRWWAKSDEPWQTLACCKEIANATRHPNHEEYVCHFPIHQDGSCNGLQHYAALGGDSAGAFSVNLAHADRPQDVYSAVVTLVEAGRARDAASGLQIAQQLEGFVSRKVIKQTVMTTVYGVTKYGARLQIAKQLKDIDAFPKDLIWSASTYLAKKTFESLQEMFTSTKEIQDWFTECAKLISGVCGKKMEWTTPLGLPVIQEYYKIANTLHFCKDRLYEYSLSDFAEKPCTMKQKNAFPPNFIHSLDSSHMMLTSLYSEASNITFVSVHDCFWTHPSTVEIMNKICREQFVALHSQPILETLSNDLVKKFSFDDSTLQDNGSVKDMSRRKLNDILRQLPKKGNFDLQNVLNSVYFFS